MRTRTVVFLLVLVVIGGVGVAMWRGVGPLPDPEGCATRVAGTRVDLSPEQARNASVIAAVGVRRELPARAVSIALATAFQESKLRNLDHGDRDSLGIFQQRPSQGWGTKAQVRDPYYASNAFYEVLAKIDGFQTMRITEAAQKVQRSGYPEAYEPHAADARALASALTGYSRGGRFTCVVHASDGKGTYRAATAHAGEGLRPARRREARPPGLHGHRRRRRRRAAPGLGGRAVPHGARGDAQGHRGRVRRQAVAGRQGLRAGLDERQGGLGPGQRVAGLRSGRWGSVGWSWGLPVHHGMPG